MEGIINAGMNVARLNMSHGDYSEHASRYDLVRDTAERLGKRVAIMGDLQGPKIRLGKFEGGQKHLLNVGDEFTITIDDPNGTVPPNMPTRTMRPPRATRATAPASVASAPTKSMIAS